jgi:TPR repeat protein
LYLDGAGVEQDPALAQRWFRKAADQDHPPAQFSLGLLYEQGRGVEADPKRAMFWFNKAAEFGDADAEEKLRRVSDE